VEILQGTLRIEVQPCNLTTLLLVTCSSLVEPLIDSEQIWTPPPAMITELINLQPWRRPPEIRCGLIKPLFVRNLLSPQWSVNLEAIELISRVPCQRIGA